MKKLIKKPNYLKYISFPFVISRACLHQLITILNLILTKIVNVLYVFSKGEIILIPATVLRVDKQTRMLMEFFLGFKKNEIFIINEMVKLNFYYLKKGKI